MSEPTTTSTRSEVAMATDRRLYFLSNLVDTVRDTSRELLSLATKPDTAPATSALIARYNALLSSIADTVDPTERELLDQWAPQLADDATLVVVLDSATTLARIADIYLGSDAFVAGRVQQRLEINSALTQAPVAYPDLDSTKTATPSGLPLAAPAAATGPGQGQYL